ncbi:MAG: four helix bundle protein [Bacilli bacterium]|nr:four helix bundle protein [Bacilli bacterium]
MNEVEELIIYKQYVELICYTELVTDKFPKKEKLALVSTIKSNTYEGLKNIIKAYKKYDKIDKLNALTNLDIDMKMLKVMIRLSYKNKYISIKNYTAWSKKISNICNMLGGWIKSCQKQ